MKYYSIENIILLAISIDLDYIGMLTPVDGKLRTGTVSGDKLMMDLAMINEATSNKIDHHTFEAHIATPTTSYSSEQLGTYYKVLENIKAS